MAISSSRSNDVTKADAMGGWSGEDCRKPSRRAACWRSTAATVA
jgi:hypothetical protein